MPNSDFVDNGPSEANDGSLQTSSALKGAAAGAAAGSLVFPVIGTAIGAVVGGIVGYFSAPKKAVYKPINVDAIVKEARQGYADNYNNSINLEKAANPASAYARGATDVALGNAADQSSAGFKARNSMLDDLTTGKGAALYNESSDSILQQLRLGGQLDPETQAAVVRGALSKGGQAGLSGSDAARGLTARDLGLTSLQLLQARQGQAQGAVGVGLSRLAAGSAAAGQDASTAAMLGQIFNARGLPTSGLDPGAVAALRVANTKGQNAVDMATLLQENTARAQNVNSVLSLGSGLASAYGGGGGGGAGTGSGAGLASGAMAAFGSH